MFHFIVDHVTLVVMHAVRSGSRWPQECKIQALSKVVISLDLARMSSCRTIGLYTLWRVALFDLRDAPHCCSHFAASRIAVNKYRVNFSAAKLLMIIFIRQKRFSDLSFLQFLQLGM